MYMQTKDTAEESNPAAFDLGSKPCTSTRDVDADEDPTLRFRSWVRTQRQRPAKAVSDRVIETVNRRPESNRHRLIQITINYRPEPGRGDADGNAFARSQPSCHLDDACSCNGSDLHQSYCPRGSAPTLGVASETDGRSRTGISGVR